MLILQALVLNQKHKPKKEILMLKNTMLLLAAFIVTMTFTACGKKCCEKTCPAPQYTTMNSTSQEAYPMADDMDEDMMEEEDIEDVEEELEK